MNVCHTTDADSKTLCPLFYGNEVESVLQKLNLTSDSIDSADFNVISYINQRFPSEQSLANIDEVIMELEGKIHDLDDETRTLLRSRWQTEDKSQEVVQETMQMIKMLFSRIQDVQDRATRSEEMVRDITRDIQQLDQAKRNLTISITALNNLILIVNALDRLNELLGIHQPLNEMTQTKNFEELKADSQNPFSEDSSPDRESHRNQLQSNKLTTHFLSEASNLLAQVQRLLEPILSAYGTVPSVNSLSHELDNIHSILAERLTRELKLMLGAVRKSTDNTVIIKSACNLVDLFPKNFKIKSEILGWFLSRHLAEYKELFESTQVTAWLDKIDHRYTWLRTNLTAMESLVGKLFPEDWLVQERFVVEFCRITRSDLEVVLKRRQSELSHNLIIFALQRTLAFEATLNKMYTGDTLKEYGLSKASGKLQQCSTNPFDEDIQKISKDSGEETANDAKLVDNQDWKKQPFDGIISSCFDPYFDLYLNHVEKALKDQLTNRLIGDFTINKSSLTSRDLSDVFKEDNTNEFTKSNAVPNDAGENTLYSATDLFLLFKQILKQTLQLNRSRGLLGLVRLLKQYLSEYTIRVLLTQIPGITVSGNAGATPDVAAKMAAFGLSSLSVLGLGRGQSATNASSDTAKPLGKGSSSTNLNASDSTNQLYSSLLRDDFQLTRLSNEDVHKVCVILVTTAFCYKTVEELEKRLKVEIKPPKWSSKISFSNELDELAACRSACVHRLVADLESATEPQLSAMSRLPWNNLVQVGDQSVYVTAIVNHLRTQMPLIRDTLYTVRPAFTQICTKFADALITRFVMSLYRCKPVNTFGAEQLLLDAQSLKAALLQMPLMGAKFSQPPPRSFTNLVHEGMGRAERIIKAVMLPVGATVLGPVNLRENSSITGGFIMGPVDNNAAEVFLSSYQQLLPDSNAEDLQKVLEMKGVKGAEQQLILDIFRDLHTVSTSSTDLVNREARIKEEGNNPGKSSELSTNVSESQSSQDQQSVGNRMGRLEKLLSKRR